PESYQRCEDYTVGIAEMDDGFKVLAWIRCDDPKKLRRGARVRLEIAKIRENDIPFYHLIPAEE
ncbi:MAG: OB-fold domain-containing protein, partial [Nitrososphaerota archaeon]